MPVRWESAASAILGACEDGRTERTRLAPLIASSVQGFSIQNNDETFVTYRFETNGEIVEFGQGRLVVGIEVTERAGESQRALIENAQDALQNFTLEGTLAAALDNAGSTSVDALDAYHAVIDSYNDSPGRDPNLVHCDDETTDGSPSLNGFPLACPRLEGQQFDNLDSWFPIAAVNRLDLAPTTGENCGQQRLIFANNNFIGNGRMFIIIEAQVPNPDPECGIAACLPIAEFWDSLSTVTDPAERGARLADAFLTSGTGPLGPFMNAGNLGPNGGQLRTNNFNDFQWTLREFHFQDAPAILPVPVSVAEAPNGELWNDTSPLAVGEGCRESFLSSVGNLLSNDVSAMAFPVADECEDAESPNDFFRQDYSSHLFSGSGDFAQQLEEAVAGTGLTAGDIANRARFAGSCMGCHIETSGFDLGGGLVAPFREDFVQVSEFGGQACSGGGTCFGLSEALRTVFLPHRLTVLRNLLDSGLSCGGSEADAGVSVEIARLAADPSTGIVRTLGGQPVVAHAH